MKKKLQISILFLLWMGVTPISSYSSGVITGFIENKNQWPSSIDYLVSIPGGRMAVEAGRFRYFFFDYEKAHKRHQYARGVSLNQSGIDNYENGWLNARSIQARFVNSNADSKPKGYNKSNAYANYFLGNDPAHWGTRAYSFEKLCYEDFYPGIDLVLKIMGDHVKYDLIVSPNANPNTIMIAYEGMVSISLSSGDIIIDAGLATITEKRPIAYQVIDGKRKKIPVRYELVGNQISFFFPEGYNPYQELIIDPTLIFSTFSGFTADNWGSAATPAEQGKIYSSGVTNEVSSGGVFSATSGAFQMRYGGLYDIGIYKYDSLGEKLIYASFLGGKNSESPHSLIINSDEDLLIMGTTGSRNFPVTAKAFDQSFAGGHPLFRGVVVEYDDGSDLFVSKISREGDQLLASTYLGGTHNDGVNTSELNINYGDIFRGDIIVDRDDNIYIASCTSSSDFPTLNSFSPSYLGGFTDGLVLQMTSDLSALTWAAFVGGDESDALYTIKIDDTDNKLVVAGGTTSFDLPFFATSHRNRYQGNIDGWIAKLNTDGSAVTATTYVGTSKYDQVYFVDLDEAGAIYVYGQTTGNFPITPGKYGNPNSGQFLQKFTNDLSTRMLSTVFGSGSGFIDIVPTAFLVSANCNSIYMTGWGGLVNQEFAQSRSMRNPFIEDIISFTESDTYNLPVTPDAFQSRSNGSDFYFIVLQKDAQDILYATFLGGPNSYVHVDGGTSRFDKKGIVYHTVCSGCNFNRSSIGDRSDFPTTANAWSSINASQNCNNVAFKFDLIKNKASLQTNSVDLDAPGLTRLCLPSKIVFQNNSLAETGVTLYRWNFGDGNSVDRTDKDDITYEYKKPGIYPVSLQLIDRTLCLQQDTDYKIISIFGNNASAGKDRTICQGQTSQLDVIGGSIYKPWKNEDGEEISYEPSIVVKPENSTLYTVTIQNDNGCILEDTVRVGVTPRIDVEKIELLKINDCESRTKLKIVNNIDNLDNASLSIDYGDGKSSAITSSSEFVHDYEQDGDYHVSLVGTRGSCIYNKSLDIPVFTIRTPNVITPGGSPGFNDTFKITYGKIAPSSIPTTHLSIYNRWGNVVFDDPDYTNDWSAESHESGVYYYKIKINDAHLCKGWLEVIH